MTPPFRCAWNSITCAFTDKIRPMALRVLRRAGSLLVLIALSAVHAGASRQTAALDVTPPKLEIEHARARQRNEGRPRRGHARPVLNLQVWYHVGSKNERKGRTGFAHLFEHMMFRGSKNVGPEEHMRFIREAGGPSTPTRLRSDRVLADRAVQLSRARDLARGGSHGLARRQRGELQEGARGRQGRAAAALREPAVRDARRKRSSTRRSRSIRTSTCRSAAWTTSTRRPWPT